MLKWLKWIIAPREMAELERWRIECGQAERWLAESDDARHALEYVRGMAEGVKCQNIAWVRDRLRQRSVNVDFKIRYSAREESRDRDLADVGMDELASTRRESPHHRKNRDAAERRLSWDADMAEVGGIEYRFLGATGEEK